MITNVKNSNATARSSTRTPHSFRYGWTVFFALSFCLRGLATEPRWTTTRVNQWYEQQPWLVGSNFIPSTAVNELEMWQPDTFDLPTIDRELGWAQALGMNTMRVFLHNLLWKQDAQGFLSRMDQFLVVADSITSELPLCCWIRFGTPIRTWGSSLLRRHMFTTRAGFRLPEPMG
jgi:hypothetical protein